MRSKSPSWTAIFRAAHGAVRTPRASRFLVGGPPLTDLTQYVDLIDSLLGPDDDPKSAFHDLKKIEGLRFDGSKCATCPRNCCIVHDPDEQYIAIREDELATIYAAYPGAAKVRANKKGKDGRRYYTVSKKGARCAFLGDDQKCTVYSARPRYCRENPGNAVSDSRMGRREVRSEALSGDELRETGSLFEFGRDR